MATVISTLSENAKTLFLDSVRDMFYSVGLLLAMEWNMMPSELLHAAWSAVLTCLLAAAVCFVVVLA